MSYTKEKNLMDGDISNEEFEEKYVPFYNNFNNYMKTFAIPDVVAFYLASGYDKSSLDDCSLRNHINSTVDIFNCRRDIDIILPSIEKVLNIKYNLKLPKEIH